VRKCWAKSIVAASLVSCLVSCGSDDLGGGLELPDAPEMNVIVISFDALRAESLGVYGYQRPTSPNIDRFAEDALVFDNVQNAANSTPTSFASSWTGKLPHRVFRGWRLDDADTLAEAFAEEGYRTAAFLNNAQLVPERNFDQGFDEYRVYKKRRTDTQVLEDAIAWLESSPGEPFFMWVHFLSPHAPYDVREMAEAFYDADYRGPYETSSGRGFETDDPVAVRRLRDLYDGEVLFADWLFGQLWGVVGSSGLADNTLVVLTSDHGEELHEHGLFGHHRLYQQVLRTPMILRHPLVEGGRTDIVMQNIDLFPTLAGMLGLSAPEMDGLDLRKGVPAERVRVSVNMTNRKYHGMALRRNSEKFIVRCTPLYDEEYYDLDSDPGEQLDILPEHLEEVETLFLVLEEIVGGNPCQIIFDAVEDVGEFDGLDEETIERLKSLGYIQ